MKPGPLKQGPTSNCIDCAALQPTLHAINVLPSDLSFVWFVVLTTGRLARARVPLEKGVGDSPSNMISRESADASDKYSVWSPKLVCGLCVSFGLLVCEIQKETNRNTIKSLIQSKDIIEAWSNLPEGERENMSFFLSIICQLSS